MIDPNAGSLGAIQNRLKRGCSLAVAVCLAGVACVEIAGKWSSWWSVPVTIGVVAIIATGWFWWAYNHT
jgi:hypothetical protein